MSVATAAAALALASVIAVGLTAKARYDACSDDCALLMLWAFPAWLLVVVTASVALIISGEGWGSVALILAANAGLLGFTLWTFPAVAHVAEAAPIPEAEQRASWEHEILRRWAERAPEDPELEARLRAVGWRPEGPFESSRATYLRVWEELKGERRRRGAPVWRTSSQGRYVEAQPAHGFDLSFAAGSLTMIAYVALPPIASTVLLSRLLG